MNIPYHYEPRPYQIRAIEALDNGVRLAVLVFARRSGKTMMSYCYAGKRLVQDVMNTVLVFPTKEQARSVFWDNIENDGFKTIDHIPDSLIGRKDNHNMRLTLKNGSTFQVLGTTDPDSLRGANGKLYIFDEFVDQDSAALDVVRPIVAANGGQIIAQSTPKIDGPSGATFESMYKRALITPGQYADLVTADAYMDKEVLEELRQEYIAKYGNDFFFRQEFYCDFGAASSSSYYSESIKLIEDSGNIGSYPYQSDKPVFTAWDLGLSDSTAICFFQVVDKRIRIIDFFETNNIGLPSIISFVTSKPYVYGWHFLPHDGAVRDMTDAISRIQKIRELGLPNSVLLRREGIDIGINRMVSMARSTYFNEETTDVLRRKLLIYKRKFNPLTGNYAGPDHKTESHAADSYRMIGSAWEQYFDKDTGKVFMDSGTSVTGKYQREKLSFPSLRISI